MVLMGHLSLRLQIVYEHVVCCPQSRAGFTFSGHKLPVASRTET
jgi:uncharacterized membrane protein